MNTQHIRPRFAAALACAFAVVSSPVLAQDTLARAKDFYASAAYEEALQVLGRLHNSASPAAADATEVAAYQMYCLVALGRSDEAKTAVQSIVRMDPFYRPSEEVVSPRVRTFFLDVRRPLLPEVVRQTYARAKEAYDQRDVAAAASEFDRVITLLDELGSGADQGVADLRTLAAGFRDLSKTALVNTTPAVSASATERQPTAGSVASPSAPPASPVSDAQRIYGADDAGVTRPAVISRALPEWKPSSPLVARQDYRGALVLIIDEDGLVRSASMLKSAHPIYDPILLRAAQDWKFKPATKGGMPVRFRYTLDIQLSATSR